MYLLCGFHGNSVDYELCSGTSGVEGARRTRSL